MAWCAGRLRSASVEERFLAVWIVLFFAGALALFFAGSARYLLPMAAPLALLASRALAHRPRWLTVAFVAQLALGLALVVRINEAYGTIEEDEILERDRDR